MGDVIALVKVMPRSTDVDLEALKDSIQGAIPEGIKLNGIDEKPIAFGLTALNVTVQMADEGGSLTESLEAALMEIGDVESAEVVDVGRLM